MSLDRRIAGISFIRPFWDFVFPPVCHVCDGPLDADEEWVCGGCWKRMRRIHPCDPLYCTTLERLSAIRPVSGLVAEFVFEKDGPFQTLVSQLKYEQVTGLGVELGRLLGARVLGSVPLGGYEGLLPVPLHTAKRRERGYNQSLLIAQGVSSVTGLPVLASILRRQKYTKSQTAMNAVERRHNVAGAFTIPPRFRAGVRGKSFLLVDDVITTGATVSACAEVLGNFGAAGVVACAVALAALSPATNTPQS